MFCPNCKNNIDDNSNFCPLCGCNIVEFYEKLHEKDMNKSSFCSETINAQTKNCGYWGILKTILLFVSGVGIATLLLWILFYDYPLIVANKENFWYGQYLSAGQLHALLLIWLTQVFIALKK